MTAIFIQARMSSTRLPGKVLLDLAGKPVLKWVIERCRCVSLASNVIILTSTDQSDEPIIEFCKAEKVDYYRGPLEDVLGRFDQAVKFFGVENFVRITADCPLIDPVIVDAVILNGLANELDYTGLSGRFPDGLDCTYFSERAINLSALHATKKYQREHIGQYVEENPSEFNCGEVKLFLDHADIRLTLDQVEDYDFLNNLIKICGSHLSTPEILKTLQLRPELMKINSNITRNEGLIKSKEQR